MRKFEFEVLGLGFNNKGYPGAFTPSVEGVIKSVLYGRVLHLYSGISKIGDVRIDIERPEATHNMSVEEFISGDNQIWDWVLLDPPYKIKHVDKLKAYGDRQHLSDNTLLRDRLKKYFKEHTDNILWLDQCAPNISGFKREKLWLFLPGGFYSVRVLSWLKREMKQLL